MLESLAGFFFPSACYGCARPGPVLCAACAPRPANVRRLRFGTLTVFATGAYAGSLRRAILAFKHGRRDAGPILASLLARRLVPRLPRNALLVPVPTAPSRRRARGFDQSVRLAQGCAQDSGHAIVQPLAQIVHDAQRGRSRMDRLRARGRFRCTAPQLVAGTRIVLVDDVVTTGATLRDCAATLQECGAIVSEAIVLAYA